MLSPIKYIKNDYPFLSLKQIKNLLQKVEEVYEFEKHAEYIKKYSAYMIGKDNMVLIFKEIHKDDFIFGETTSSSKIINMEKIDLIKFVRGSLGIGLVEAKHITEFVIKNYYKDQYNAITTKALSDIINMGTYVLDNKVMFVSEYNKLMFVYKLSIDDYIDELEPIIKIKD